MASNRRLRGAKARIAVISQVGFDKIAAPFFAEAIHMWVTHRLSFVFVCFLLPVLSLAQQQQSKHPQQFTVVIHPKFDLPANQATVRDDEVDPTPQSYINGQPTFVVGTSAKDAPSTHGFILVLEEPTINSFTSVQTGHQQGTDREKSIPYKGVNVIMPYTLWHRSADGDPIALGHSFAWNRVAQVKYLGVDGAVDRYQFVNQSQEEMIRLALREKIRDIFLSLSNCWAASVVNQAPQTMPTEKQAIAMLRDAVDGQIHTSNLRAAAVFKPSRVSKDEKGNTVVEIDLWNRLPVRASGLIESRSETGLPFNQAPPFHRNSTKFNLAPGEKAVARIVFDDPDDPRGNLAWFRNDEVFITSDHLGPLNEDNPRNGPRGNRTSRVSRGVKGRE